MNVQVHVVVIHAQLHVELNVRTSVGVVQVVMQHAKMAARIHA